MENLFSLSGRHSVFFGELCQLGRRRMGFRGHIVSQEGVGTDPAKIEAVQSWPAPNSTTEVMHMYGLCNFDHSCYQLAK